MKITSVFTDIYSFLRTLLSGNSVETLWGGELWALSILIAAAVFCILHKKQRLGIIKALLAWLTVAAFSYYYIDAVSPITFSAKGQPFGSFEGTYFSIFWKPFYDFTSIGQVFGVYWSSMVFFLVMGFAFALVFRFAYRLQGFAVFAAGSELFYIALILTEDLIFGGVIRRIDLSLPILCLPMMFLGWGLARLVIHLNRGIYDRIQQIGQTEAV